MAVIDLTLDSFKVPAIDGYTPPFGTMVTRTEANKGGLSTVEVNSNVMMPFANMRPKIVMEDSSTTAVEYDAKIVFPSSLASGCTLTLGNGAYEGCEILVKNLSAYGCTVSKGTWSYVVPAGGYVKLEWNGSAWSEDVSSAVQAAIGGSLPVGTVIYYYGLVAPSGWFICDGTDTTGTPDELSTHHPELYALLGNTNVLPDLRGEFLRGAGTNSRTNQGSGGNVGEHQDATVLYPQIHYAHDIIISNQDSNIPGITQGCYEHNNSTTYTKTGWTFRPTNTSLNIIIKG